MQKANNNNNFLVFLSSTLILTVLVSLNFYPNEFSVTSFDRSIGQSILYNVSVEKRIFYFYLYNFIVYPFVFLIILKLVHKLLDHYNNSKVINFLYSFTILSFLPLIMLILRGENGFRISVLITFVIELLIITFIYFDKRSKLVFEDLEWSFYASYPLALCLTLFFHKESKFSFAIIYMISSIILYFISKNTLGNKKIILQKSYAIFMTSPIIILFVNELFNILNQHNIYINHRLRILTLIYIFLFIIFGISYYKKKELIIKYDYKKLYLPLILFSVALLSTQLKFENKILTDFFEQANHSISINSLFKYGKVPIFQTFDAHMLYYQIGSYIYGILNADWSGAVFIGYSLYPIYVLFSYLFLSKFVKKELVFFYLTFMFFSIGGIQSNLIPISIIALIFIKTYRSKSYVKYLLLMITLFLSVLLRADFGFSVILSAFFILIIILVKDKKIINIKYLTYSTLTFLIILVSLITTSYFFIKVPKTRLLEIFYVLKSNINWSYSAIFSDTNIGVIIFYSVLPIAVFILSLHIIIKRKLTDVNIALLFLGFFYIFNFQRALVRHSLLEGAVGMEMISILSMYILIYSYQLMDIRKRVFSIHISYIIIIFLKLIVDLSMFNQTSLIDSALGNYTSFETYSVSIKEKIKRVSVDSSMENIYLPLKSILDKTIEKDETYLDFTNQTLLYVFLNRENPVFVNQSPGLVSGEHMQSFFIDEIEANKKVIYALLPSNISNLNLSFSLDGILNSYRYYLISEYISKNYLPLVEEGNFVLWVRKDKYTEKLNKISGLKLENSKNVNYDYLGLDKHTYDLQYLPLIWNDYDKVKKIELKNVLNSESIESGKINPLNLESIDKTKGNYIYVNITSNMDKVPIEVNLMSGSDVKVKYIFIAKESKNQGYLLRVSSDFLWYSGMINNIQINSPDNVKINKISIMKGDTLK